MYIILTSQETGHSVLVSASTVLYARRNPKSQLCTDVVTGIMGPGGPQAFVVKESVEEVGRRIIESLRFANPQLEEAPLSALGFPTNGEPSLLSRDS